jgi:flagellar basal-body rod protein FlgB
MLDDLKLLKTMSAMASHAARRHEVLAQNIANADTPGYRAKDVQSFADAFQEAARTGKDVHQIASAARLVETGGAMSPNGNSVSLEDQMLRSAEAKGQHDMALAVYKKSLDLMRLSLGRK